MNIISSVCLFLCASVCVCVGMDWVDIYLTWSLYEYFFFTTFCSCFRVCVVVRRGSKSLRPRRQFLVLSRKLGKRQKVWGFREQIKEGGQKSFELCLNSSFSRQRNEIGCIQSTIRQSQSDNTIRRSTRFNASGRLRSTWISQWMTENESCLLTNSSLRRSIRTSGETTTQQYFKPTVNHGSGKVSELDTWTELIPQW